MAEAPQPPRPGRIPVASLAAVTHDSTVLTVRRWRTGDIDEYHRAMHESYEHLQPWMPWAMAEPQEYEAHREILHRFSSEWTFDDFVYGVFLGDRVVGGTGLHNRIGADGWEIGYWIHPGFEGRGFVTAVVRALIEEAFVDPAVKRVEIRCDAANERSVRVPRRLGFAFVGTEPRVPVAASETEEGHVYRIDRGVWESERV